jgi:hypothetical protein
MTGSSCLVLDNRIFSDISNAELVLGRVDKHKDNPLFEEDYFDDSPRHWEVRFDNVYPSVVRDPCGGYRAWYFSFLHDGPLQDIPKGQRSEIEYRSQNRQDGMLYAESVDGLKWNKPALGCIDVNGSSENNIVMSTASHGIHAGGVLVDEDDPDPKRRHKALLRSSTQRKMAVAFSEDGIHWSTPRPWPEYDAVGDTHNNAIWAPELERYVGITRGWSESPYKGERTVLRTESEDFLDWSEPVEVLRGSGPHDQIYSMPISYYAGIYLGFPAVFHKGDPEAPDWDTVSTELAWSPDSIEWNRVRPGEQFIPRGTGTYPDGDYDCGCVYASAPIVDDDQVRIYYGGSNGLHSGWREGSFNLATVERDRFAGFVAVDVDDRACLTTVRMRVVDQDLTVNAEVAAGGHLRAGLADQSGRPVEGFELEDCVPAGGDLVDVPLRWSGGRLADAGCDWTSVTIELSSAVLFAIGGLDAGTYVRRIDDG